MIRLLGALERLSPAQKITAGAWFEAWFKKINSGWPLGRLGARDLFHGESADVVPRDAAERWLETLLALDWQRRRGRLAAVLLARFTGDADRDVSKPLRDQALQRLTAARASSVWIDRLTRPTALSEGDARRLLGDALPAGLRLA